MNNQSDFKCVLRTIDSFIETINSEYESFDLERLDLTNKTILDMYIKLIESFRFVEEVDHQLIRSSVEKIIDVCGKIATQLGIKEEERLSQMTKEETIKHLKEESIKLDSALTKLIDMGESGLTLNDEKINTIIKATFESYIEDCEKNEQKLKDLGEDEVYPPQKELYQYDKDKKISKCSNMIIWVEKNKNLFPEEMVGKIIIKLMSFYGSVYGCNVLESPIKPVDKSDDFLYNDYKISYILE